MKKPAEALLQREFTTQSDTQREAELRLGLDLPNVHAIRRAVLDDLVDASPYGVKWWMPQEDRDQAARIFISDYLCACLFGAIHHLTSSRIHLLEFQDCSDHESSVFERSILRSKPPTSPLDHLAGKRAEVAADAVIAALASSLDCLAGLTVGVAAVPIKIKTADFSTVCSHFRDLRQSKARGVTRSFVSDIAELFAAAVSESGPPGWSRWMFCHRNTLIHRGRRIVMHVPVPKTEILAPDGIPARWSANVHLPNHPGLTEVEAFLVADSPGSLVLAERAEVTLKGLIDSTAKLVERIATRLLDVWKFRRDDPHASPQPFRRQWRAPTARDWSAFAGYAPGTDPVTTETLNFSKSFVKRLGAAVALRLSTRTLGPADDTAGFAARARRYVVHGDAHTERLTALATGARASSGTPETGSALAVTCPVWHGPHMLICCFFLRLHALQSI